MLKEGSYQSRTTTDLRQLLRHLGFERLALPKRTPGRPRPFCITPHQLIRVQVWGLAGQYMQRQLALECGNILRDRFRLVRRQAIQDQMQRLAMAPQHPAQEGHKPGRGKFSV